ncbi:hypothetical protein BRL53_02235 [Corynebacterium ulcerans]|uniref:hypothetical protein n=1 Tax=Corynebacterium ulcerans TaxID=65058 RepID=UPI000C76F367|nr:hypothetical protein [Corynebacterium ulcerans]PLW00667.1 hypothetical protein BRL53_02235 [Corynebacterium ulcerans]
MIENVVGRDIPVIDYFADDLHELRQFSDDYVFSPHKTDERAAVALDSVVPLTCDEGKISTTRMRDTWATVLLDAGVPAEVVRSGLGASDSAGNRYASLASNGPWEAFRFQLHGRTELEKTTLRSV